MLQFINFRIRQFIHPVDHNKIGFFDLLAKNIVGLGRKSAGGFATQNPQTVTRLQDDSIRSNVQRNAIHFRQWANHGCHKIRAAANRFRQNDLRKLSFSQMFHCRSQRVEVAAKARACDFAHIESLRTQALRVHKIGRLIVGDDANFLALIHIVSSKSRNCGCLSGAQKSADHDVNRFHERDFFSMWIRHRPTPTSDGSRLVKSNSTISYPELPDGSIRDPKISFPCPSYTADHRAACNTCIAPRAALRQGLRTS